MKCSEPHRRNYAILLALFLLGSGIFLMLDRDGSELSGQNHLKAELGSSWLGRRIVENPIFSFLPRWSLNIWTVSISRERNAKVLDNVFEVFDPSLRSFLTSVPIIIDSTARTAKAYQEKGYIGVSPDWDKTVGQSAFRAIYEERGMKPDEPVFIYRFKANLLIHEYLHILQFQQGIDLRSCYDTIARWYLDPRYGIPNPNGIVNTANTNGRRPDILTTNRMKYVLWYQLYNYQGLADVPGDDSWQNMQYRERYRAGTKGVEEFAYIGEEILASGSASANYIQTGQWSANNWQDKKMRLREVSPEVIALYRGLFNPELTHRQIPNSTRERIIKNVP